MQRKIEYVVSETGVITCNGSRMPQLAGVQGEHRACVLVFNLSAVWNENANYFIEFVAGNGSPIILLEDSDIFTIDVENKIINVELPDEVTIEGGEVEIRLVEEVFDEENFTTAEGNTYAAMIYFQNKNKAISILKNKAYGILVECKKLITKCQNTIAEAEDVLSNIDNMAGDGLETYEDGNGDTRFGVRLLETGGLSTNCGGPSDVGKLGVLCGDGVKISDNKLEVDTDFIATKEDLTNHNVNEEAHNDIRILVSELTARINALLDSDDTTLDQMSEIVAYIKSNKSLIDSITTSKVNVSDIIDNLTTSVSNKPLSAKQGVMLKSLIDAITVPTKLSELTDDIGVNDKADKTDLELYDLPRNIRITSYDSSSVAVKFETENGSENEARYDIDLTVDGKFDVYIYKIAIDGGNYVHGITSETIENSVARVFAFNYTVEGGKVVYLSTDGVNYLIEEKVDAISLKNKNSLDSVLESNSEYYLGDVSTETTLSFPSSANVGDALYINFNCVSQFALTIDMTNTSDIDIDIEEGVSYEIFATFNGSIWILGYNEYTVS